MSTSSSTPTTLKPREAIDFGVSSRLWTDFFNSTPSVFAVISTFGHIICKYELNKEDDNWITSAPIRGSMEHVIDVAPTRRDLYLTTTPGVGQILAIFRKSRCSMKFPSLATLADYSLCLYGYGYCGFDFLLPLLFFFIISRCSLHVFPVHFI